MWRLTKICLQHDTTLFQCLIPLISCRIDKGFFYFKLLNYFLKWPTPLLVMARGNPPWWTNWKHYLSRSSYAGGKSCIFLWGGEGGHPIFHPESPDNTCLFSQNCISLWSLKKTTKSVSLFKLSKDVIWSLREQLWYFKVITTINNTKFIIADSETLLS